jgi:hypothetical protein
MHGEAYAVDSIMGLRSLRLAIKNIRCSWNESRQAVLLCTLHFAHRESRRYMFDTSDNKIL